LFSQREHAPLVSPCNVPACRLIASNPRDSPPPNAPGELWPTGKTLEPPTKPALWAVSSTGLLYHVLSHRLYVHSFMRTMVTTLSIPRN
jgi:hypothetical protein